MSVTKKVIAVFSMLFFLSVEAEEVALESFYAKERQALSLVTKRIIGFSHKVIASSSDLDVVAQKALALMEAHSNDQLNHEQKRDLINHLKRLKEIKNTQLRHIKEIKEMHFEVSESFSILLGKIDGFNEVCGESSTDLFIIIEPITNELQLLQKQQISDQYEASKKTVKHHFEKNIELKLNCKQQKHYSNELKNRLKDFMQQNVEFF